MKGGKGMSDPANIAIVIVAYNRPKALSNLLNDLNKADYEDSSVPLIISIDHSGSDSAFEVADAFDWKHGEKKIIRRPSNLGLKKHVLTCGDLVKDYDAVIVLEDDLMVSPAMFSYARRAVEKYKDNKNIAAISLYAKGWSETAMQTFTPALSGDDTYFIQTAESWGQIWLKDEWLRFRDWLKDNETPFDGMHHIPHNVRDWDERSWKKYHIRYFVENNKYTVYPYMSLTRCCGEEGEHLKNNKKVSNASRIQVPLIESPLHDFRFADFDDEKAVKYDAFLERVIENSGACYDLYGQKTQFKGYRYVITPKNLNYKIVETYGLLLRPHEDNVRFGQKGDYFLKYDLSQRQSNSSRIKSEEALMFYSGRSYENVANSMRISEMLRHLFRVAAHRIKKKFRRKKK